MPYLKPELRAYLDNGETANTPGELNYELTRSLIRYVRVVGLSYQTINDILGALEGAKQEFYRRVAAPYEERKREENGDVYPV